MPQTTCRPAADPR